MSTALIVIGLLGVLASIIALIIHIVGKKNLKVWSALLVVFAVVLIVGIVL